MPPAISASVEYGTDLEDWGANRALYELQSQGVPAKDIVQAAADVAVALWPIVHERLVDRLTALGMMMSPNRPGPEARIWVSEMARLLGHLPEDILNDAIDAVMRECKFLPTVAEIIAYADTPLRRRKRIAARLTSMAALAGQGVVIRKIEPPAPEPVKPLRLVGSRPDDRPRKPTRQDYIEMGVDPATLDALHTGQ